MSDALARALAEAGGSSAPESAGAQIRALLADALAEGEHELELPRSGYATPVPVAIAARAGRLVAVAPVAEGFRADPARASERAWLLVAALVGALVGAGDELPASETALEAGSFDTGRLALAVPAREPDPELALLAFEEHAAGIDRLRARGLAMPAHVLERTADMRPPVGRDHPLRVAEVVARLGGNPADERVAEALEDAVLASLPAEAAATRPHDDPVPARRVARRILQRMAGMGKWGGYHTAWDHLARGFEGNDRRLAQEVGELLVRAGLLLEKPSVGQRHVFLNPRRAQDIHALVDDARMPPGLDLG